ncbi:MAG: TIGR02147 family protein [Chitinivibrionales bacterium]|nr:TIGR02147 family protein [Chitinivibrionales bacterium]
MKPVVEYSDYRAYLSDVVERRKAEGLPASNRWFAQKMGINSTSWLCLVIKGRIGLSKITANKISEILRHSKMETQYFEALVFFNQAHTVSERNRYYEELCSLVKMKEVRLIARDQYAYYSEWYHSVVRALIDMHGFTGDFKALAAKITPPVTPAQARKSIELLEALHFIVKNKNGNYELTAPAITSGEDTQSFAIANFQKETMRLAQEALDRFDRGHRYVGTQTVGISSEAFGAIQQVLIDANNKIAEIANAVPVADRVYQINVQAFPLSLPPKPAKKGRQVRIAPEPGKKDVTV